MTERERVDWDERYRHAGPVGRVNGTPFMELVATRRPGPGTLLEIAGGRGEDAIWFARRGYDVTLVDISPVGLELAEHAARAQGVRLRCLQRDLDVGLPGGQWDVIYCHHYLNRDLFRRFPHALAAEGLLALCHPTVTNIERHARPSLRHLYATNEMRRLAETAGLLVIHYEESWGSNGKHEARLLARVR